MTPWHPQVRALFLNAVLSLATVGGSGLVVMKDEGAINRRMDLAMPGTSAKGAPVVWISPVAHPTGKEDDAAAKTVETTVGGPVKHPCGRSRTLAANPGAIN